MAYSQFFASDGDDVDALFEEALSRLKGCNFHFRKSLTGVMRSLEEEDSTHFKEMVDHMIQVPEIKELTAMKDQLEREFPNFLRWIRWWTQPRIAALLFKAYQNMDEDVWASLPDTTNAVESLHQSLHAHIGKKAATVVDAISQLFLFTSTLVQQRDKSLGMLHT